MIERAESSGSGVRWEEFLGRVSFTLDLPVSLILKSCQLSFKTRCLVSVSSNMSSYFCQHSPAYEALPCT